MRKPTRDKISKYFEEKTEKEVSYMLPSSIFKDCLYAFDTYDRPYEFQEEIITKADQEYTVFCVTYDEASYKIFLFDKEDNILYIGLENETISISHIESILLSIDNLEDRCPNKKIEIVDFESIDTFIKEEINIDLISLKLTLEDIHSIGSPSVVFKESVEAFIDNGNTYGWEEDQYITEGFLEEMFFSDFSLGEKQKLEKIDEDYDVFSATFDGEVYTIYLVDKEANMFLMDFNHDAPPHIKDIMLSIDNPRSLQWMCGYEKIEICHKQTFDFFISEFVCEI